MFVAMRAVVMLLAVIAAVPAWAKGKRPCDERRWRGKSIDLNLKDADLHNVFRLLADTGDTNVVVPDEVKGTITIRLRKVPWDQALCTIAESKKLDVLEDGGIYLIQPR